jgi:hypothetical protein
LLEPHLRIVQGGDNVYVSGDHMATVRKNIRALVCMGVAALALTIALTSHFHLSREDVEKAHGFSLPGSARAFSKESVGLVS